MKFGTDGVRGRAHTELTVGFAARLARAASRVLEASFEGATPSVVIGADTRESSPAFVAALTTGFVAEGVQVVDLGIAPTPLVAFECSRIQAIGAMVSASHNPWHDNGIKLFARGGAKLTDDIEAEIEAALDDVKEGDCGEVADTAGGPPAGSVHLDSAVAESYGSHIAGFIDGRSLVGLHVVLDASNGAASAIAPLVLRRLGAVVTVVADTPNGRNINDGCGATAPSFVAERVVEIGADVGIALDGDADRLIAVGHDGVVVDGDHIIAICAADLRTRGRLAHDTVVVTIMTNLGFHLAMRDAGIDVVQTGVGDRYVLEELHRGGFSLGGEQSGHVIFREHASTGDGLLTAVALLDVVARSGRSLDSLAADAMTALPQVLLNVEVAERVPDVAQQLAAEVAEVEAELGEAGRVLLRASGTENLIRVMAEAQTEKQATAAARTLADIVVARFA